ncbi:uncharacterized protein LOC128269779 [Anopheles cruzii]|uniref:uncharacterized protein LOC128269779 n=1 Tax=Anopheles cruzii TaxID=68878 RepID=UPI0022EC1889|nr:uncharacterized protein LOC128269779 [Anopheles cruzii]
MGSNCCKGEAGAQVYKGNGTEISIGPRLRKSPVYAEMMREETFQVDETPHIGAPFFLRKLTDYTVLVGTKAKLSVHVSNTKDVKVTWLKDDAPISTTDRYVCTSVGQLHSLEMATALPEDSAKWSCEAGNSLGKCVCSGQLTVRVPETYKAPEFVDELRAILTSQGTISLECKVIGYPTPELRWFKDSNEIKAGDMFGLTINGGDLASLGVYTCVATNCVGKSSSSSKVRVQEPDTLPKAKASDKISPVFVEELERIKGKIGDRMELRCKINPSAVPVSVRWYNQSGLIEANEKYSMFDDGLGCFLVDITAAELCDAGEWKCVITCKDGLIGITSNVVELDVPRNYRAPRFMEGLKAVLTEEGLVSFECKVIGYPTPILRWYKDGKELKPGDVYHLTGVNSLGSYCCVARNSLGEASSTTFLSVNDIKAQLNEEEWLSLLQVNQSPTFKTGLISRDVCIAEPFRMSVVVNSVSKPTVNWYKDDLVVESSENYQLSSDDSTYTYSIDVVVAQLDDQGEWKCVATNEFGQAGTSCFVKLIIPKHYRKPKFLENLKAVMLRDGTVNLECKVIGVPQPVLKWYKDGTELKPGDIHRIITGQDGKCCLGTYTCEAVNCMGSVSSTASLHGYDGIADEGPLPPEGLGGLVKDASLSTIHEERTSEMFDTAASYKSAGSSSRGEISFTFDGKEVSVSLYETPELTNDEALQIVQMFADQLHQNINENENVTTMPSLRFVKETSTSGQLVMEALVIDVPVVEDTNLLEDDRRTDFDIDEMVDENTFTFESGIASSKGRVHRRSSREQDDFRSMSSSEHSDLERDVMMSILSRDSLPVLTSPGKTTDAATGDDAKERLLSLIETVVFHLASIREEVRNQSDLALSVNFSERSEKILTDVLYPVQQLHKHLATTGTHEGLLDPLEHLTRGFSVIEKCVQIGGYSRTFVYRTSVCIVEGCGKQLLNCLSDLRTFLSHQTEADFVVQQKMYMLIMEVQTSLESALESVRSQRILQETDSVAALQELTSIVTTRSIFEDIDFLLKSEEPFGLLQVKNLQITVLEFEKSLATILTIVSQSDNCNVRSEIARFGLTEVLLELKNKTEALLVQCTEERLQRIVGREMKPSVVELGGLVELIESNESYAEVITCLNDMFVPLEEMKTALSKLSSEVRHVPEPEYSSNQALEQQIEEFYELIVHLKEEIQGAAKDLCSKTETQKELLETIRKNLNTLKADARNFRAQCPVSALPEKDDLLLAAFELVIERLALNPLQLDSIDYLRLLGDSLAQFSGLVRRLSAGPAVSDWLLRYQLQLLKIFDTIEFCLSEEQFIVIGSKEKYCKTSTQEAIHAAKQLITHYKITSEQNASTRKESDRHIQVVAARQGLTDTVNHASASEVRSSSQATAQRTIHETSQRRPHSQHHLAGRHARTRSPLSFTDDNPDRTPRSSSRCSLGALPSKRGPSFAVYLKNVFIERDHGFKLLCVVLDAEIDVRWTKDAIELLPSARYRIQQKNGLITLHVEHADYEDSGVYACHVFNNYGQSFNKCTVEVYDTSDDIICPSFSIPRNMDNVELSLKRCCCSLHHTAVT